MSQDQHTAVTPPANAPAITLIPGLGNPQADAQTAFHAALWALAEPGKLQTLQFACGAPEGLSVAMSALLLSLADAETPIWLPPNTDCAISAFLTFHCACPIVRDATAARFVVVPQGYEIPRLADCNQGEPAYPDRSGTLLLEVASVAEGAEVKLQGPGIETTRSLSIAGLPAGFWMQWHENQLRFPLGVDVLLTSGRQIVGLPRTTYVES